MALVELMLNELLVESLFGIPCDPIHPVKNINRPPITLRIV